VVVVLAETDEQAVRETNPEGVTYVLAETWGLGEYVPPIDGDFDTDAVAKIVEENDAD
jgi:hypothetical protein